MTTTSARGQDHARGASNSLLISVAIILLLGGHHEDFAPPGRDAIAATSLAASRRRPAVPENSSLGSAPAPSIFALGRGCRRAPCRLAQRRCAILFDAAHQHDRAVRSGQQRGFNGTNHRTEDERKTWPTHHY